SGYTDRVNRLRFFIGILAFLISASGSLPTFANESLWIGSSAARTRAEALLAALRTAAAHGLEARWYGIAEIEKALVPGADPVVADKLLTAAFIAYASDVSTG